MSSQNITDFFNNTYEETYKKVLLYIVSKCGNTEDMSDIIQETYTEFYSVIQKNGIEYIKNSEAFIIQIAKSKIYKHYKLLEKLKNILPIHNRTKEDNEISIVDMEIFNKSNEIDDKIIDDQLLNETSKYISTKSSEIKRIFYLYYYLDLTITQIATQLSMSESNVKNKLYRTVKEVRNYLNERGEKID